MTYRTNVASLVKKPSAYAPLIMSGIALALLLGALASAFMSGGIERQDDEGPIAHLYQLLMAGQIFVIAWFALRWGWRDLRAAVAVVALQGLAILITLAPLWYFGL